MKLIHIFAGAALMCATTVQASLVSVSGPDSSAGASAEILGTPPINVFDDGVTNLAMQGFDEVQDYTTLAAFNMDNSGVLAAGTQVDSHMIFLNSKASGLIEQFNVVWTFAGTILGVMSDRQGTLEAASTPELGAAGTDYTSGAPSQVAPFNARGLEGNNDLNVNDGYLIMGALNNQLKLTMRVTEPGDWIRVITTASAVPLPAAFWLFGSALIGFIGFSRRTMVA